MTRVPCSQPRRAMIRPRALNLHPVPGEAPMHMARCLGQANPLPPPGRGDSLFSGPSQVHTAHMPTLLLPSAPGTCS